LTDLERRVNAMRIWGGLEAERKEWLVNEIRKRDGGAGGGGPLGLGFRGSSVGVGD
jgi:hypothetical protein